MTNQDSKILQVHQQKLSISNSLRCHQKKNAQREKSRIMMKPKHDLYSEMKTATVRAKSRVAMKRKHQSKTEEQTATARPKTELG
jgi:hypothetical protein